VCWMFCCCCLPLRNPFRTYKHIMYFDIFASAFGIIASVMLILLKSKKLAVIGILLSLFLFIYALVLYCKKSSSFRYQVFYSRNICYSYVRIVYYSVMIVFIVASIVYSFIKGLKVNLVAIIAIIFLVIFILGTIQGLLFINNFDWALFRMEN
jgi:hypothetical protein